MTDLHSARRSTAPAFPWLGLIVLSTGVFLSITDETLPTGLLPDMSSSLGVGEPLVGLLVTVFALTVVLTSAPLVALTRRLARRTLLVAALALLGVSNILTAIAPNYGFVVGTRVIGGVAHGMFWAIVGAYAAHLVPKEWVARAVSLISGGGTLAFIFGVPLATGMGHLFGWQLAFVGLGVLTILGALLLWWLVPPVERPDPPVKAATRSGDKRKDPGVAAALVVCVMVAVVMLGHYAFYTYIAPFMIEKMHVAPGDIGFMLLIYGVAGVAGLVLAGTVFGTRTQLGTVLMLVITGVAVATLATFAAQPLIAIVAFLVWGAAFGALPPLLQTGLLHVATPAFRDTANAVFSTAFNTGIGGGALIGSVIYASVGVQGVPWFYVGALAVALIVALAFRGLRARAEKTVTAASSPAGGHP